MRLQSERGTAVGLDLGSTEFRSLRFDGERLVGRRVPAYYCVLDNQSTNRKLLDQAGITFATSHQSIVVLGQSAIDVSQLIRCPLIPVFPAGQLPAKDPVGRQVCLQLIEALLPPVETDGNLCCLTVPHHVQTKGDRSESLVKNILELRGFKTEIHSAANALILSELESTNFTGLAISLGGENISFCLAHQGTTIAKGSYSSGLRSIEEKYSRNRHRYLWDSKGNQYLDLQSVQTMMIDETFDLTTPKTGDEAWLVEHMQHVLHKAFVPMQKQFQLIGDQTLLHQRIPVIVGGRPTLIAGCTELVAQALRDNVPILRFDHLKPALQGNYSVARGLLVQATLATEAIEPVESRAA